MTRAARGRYERDPISGRPFSSDKPNAGNSSDPNATNRLWEVFAGDRFKRTGRCS